MSRTLRVLVVEDEAPARRKLLRLLASDPAVAVVAEAADGAAALAALAALDALAPNLVLLDINIPAPGGLEVAAHIAALPPPRPAIVFLTAHDDHALRAFDLRAADYLLKPYTAERLAEALARVRERLPPAPARLAVDTGQGMEMVAAAAITRLQAAGNYIEVRAGGRALLTRATLDSVQAQLDPAAFVRINRSTVVAVAAVVELRRRPHGELLVRLRDGTEALWTRRFRRTGPPIPALGQLIPKS